VISNDGCDNNVIMKTVGTILLLLAICTYVQAGSLGTVQFASITLAAGDQKPFKATGAVTTVSFTTQTEIPQAGGSITIRLPANYFSAKILPAGILVPVSGTAATLACALTASTLAIVCTTSAQAVPVGATKITFAAGELTTGADSAASSIGLAVSTSQDDLSFGAAVPALTSAVMVQSASITLAAADQKAFKATGAVTTVSFTTQTEIPQAGGSITIRLPANYFSAKAQPAGILVPVSGTAATLACALTASTLAIVCTTSAQAVPVGATKIKFFAGELTTGAAVAASSIGLAVSTSQDGLSFGAAVPALSPPGPFTVQSASIALDAGDQKALKITGAVTTVSFTTQTQIATSGTITITCDNNTKIQYHY
jgi:hypothetical protein